MKAINRLLVFLLIFTASWKSMAGSDQDRMIDWKNANISDISISDIDNALDELKPDSYEFNEAEAYFDKAVQECPNLPREGRVNAYYGKGRVLNDKDEDYEEAIRFFDRVLEIDPSCCQCLDNKGWSLFNLENFGEAFTNADKALEICPSNAHAWNNKGIYYYIHFEDFQKALECFDKAIELDPKFGDAWWDKYKAHLMLGQNKEADAALAKASECGVSEQTTGQEG